MGVKEDFSQGFPPIADLPFQPLELNRSGSTLGRRLNAIPEFCVPEPLNSSRRDHPGPQRQVFVIGVGA
jgi:hypothetical protein